MNVHMVYRFRNVLHLYYDSTAVYIVIKTEVELQSHFHASEVSRFFKIVF